MNKKGKTRKDSTIDEELLIGKLLLSPQSIGLIAFMPEELQNPKCRRAISALQKLHSQGTIPQNDKVDSAWLRQVSEYGGGDFSFLSALTEFAVTGDNPHFYARKIRKENVWREIHRESENGRDPAKIVELISKLQDRDYSDGIPGLNICAASELIARKRHAPEWLWEDSLPHPGTSMVVSKSKVGKTTFARQFGISVSRGDSFLGRNTINGPMPVVYLSFEGDPIRFVESLELFGVKDEPFYAHLGPAPPNFLDLLESIITRFCAGLIIVDTLQKALRIPKVKDYEEVVPVLERVEWIARTKFSHIMLLHHARKTEGEDGDVILGSIGLLGGVDTAIILEKHAAGRTYKSVQRYGADIPETVYRLNSDGSLSAEGSLSDASMAQTWMDVQKMAFYEDGAELTEDEILERSKGKQNKGKRERALRWALKEGFVVRDGSGTKGNPFRYFLPHDGGQFWHGGEYGGQFSRGRKPA